MTRNILAACILSLAFANVGNAQGTASPAETRVHSTQVDLKQLAHNAHAPEQYSALANYYQMQQEGYQQRAAEAKKDWERMSQNVTGNMGKYPRPVDSARNLYEYYMAKASKAATLEAKYTRLATVGSPVNAQ
jgi:hypothetical protein